jgi:hypothetical protein
MALQSAQHLQVRAGAAADGDDPHGDYAQGQNDVLIDSACDFVPMSRMHLLFYFSLVGTAAEIDPWFLDTEGCACLFLLLFFGCMIMFSLFVYIHTRVEPGKRRDERSGGQRVIHPFSNLRQHTHRPTTLEFYVILMNISPTRAIRLSPSRYTGDANAPPPSADATAPPPCAPPSLL